MNLILKDIKVNIYGYYKTDLIYELDYTYEVNLDMQRSINIHAQTDAIHSFIDGTNSNKTYLIYTSYLEELEKNWVDDSFSEEEKEYVIKTVKEKLDNSFVDLELAATRERWSGIYSGVEAMNEIDLCNFVHSLIEIISLRRKYILDESVSRTVGGPTDVAIITKSKGFEWIKVKSTNKLNL